MRKKTQGKGAPKTKAALKVMLSNLEAGKASESKGKAAKAPKLPKWLKPFPTEYIVGTEDYAALIDKHNELFDTHWLKWRVQPQVFCTIHEKVLNHYHDKK